MAVPAAHRRFNVSDAMVLVAASAIGVFHLPDYWLTWIGSPLDARQWSFSGLLSIGHILLPGASPCLAMWTLALLPLRLRRPRPRLRRLLRQPGMAALGSSSFVIVLALIIQVSALASTGLLRSLDLRSVMNMLSFSLPLMVGSSVAAAWLNLGLSGRWRPEPSWIDRAGRLVGVLWLGFLPFSVWIWVSLVFGVP